MDALPSMVSIHGARREREREQGLSHRRIQWFQARRTAADSHRSLHGVAQRPLPLPSSLSSAADSPVVMLMANHSGKRTLPSRSPSPLPRQNNEAIMEDASGYVCFLFPGHRQTHHEQIKVRCEEAVLSLSLRQLFSRQREICHFNFSFLNNTTVCPRQTSVLRGRERERALRNGSTRAYSRSVVSISLRSLLLNTKQAIEFLSTQSEGAPDVRDSKNSKTTR